MLVPLAEIAPDLRFPDGEMLRDVIARLNDADTLIALPAQDTPA